MVICAGKLVASCIALFKKPDPYWNGPALTRFEKKKAKEGIFSVIETHPDGVFAKNNPEYVEEYLNSIELDLPAGITTAK